MDKAPEQLAEANAEANNAATLYGGVDAGVTAARTASQAANASTDAITTWSVAAEGGNVSNVARTPAAGGSLPPVRKLPGSGAIGHIGGALSALGLANDVHDMTQNGVGVDNGLSATANGLGLGSYLLGFAGGAASSTAAPLMAAGAAGISLGTASNNTIAKTGWLGERSDGRGRSWSDMGADWGVAAHDAVGGGALGTAAGLATSFGGSLVGTAGTLATAPLVIADVLGSLAGALVEGPQTEPAQSD